MTLRKKLIAPHGLRSITSACAQIAILSWLTHSPTSLAREAPSQHWAFQRIQRPAMPDVRNRAWPRNAIDDFILSRLEERDLSPSPEASPTDWLRRVSYDLTGLPPTPEAIQRLEARPTERAYSAIVDELLNSPRYGEHWAQLWLDVVRYADTHGFEVNTPRPNAWPYRDYVIESFNQDKSYNRFLFEQIAGDTIGEDAATGFLVTAAALLPGQIGKDDASKRLARQDELDEIVVNVGGALLGLGIGCARCHDHKFDPISIQDYYAFQSFFAGVDYGERRVEDPIARRETETLQRRLKTVEAQLGRLYPRANSGETRPSVQAAMNVDVFEPVIAKGLRFTILETNALEPCIDELEVFNRDNLNIALAANGASTRFSGSNVSPNRHEERLINDGRYGNSSSWMSDSAGSGWVEVHFPEPQSIDRVQWGRDRTGQFTDRLAIRYRIEILDAKDQWREVANASDRRPFLEDESNAPLLAVSELPESVRSEAKELVETRQRLTAKLKRYPDGGRWIFAGQFRDPNPMAWLRRGDPEQPMDPVSPSTPGALDFDRVALPQDAADGERRVALANWIISNDHPLTPRVLVNRVWLGHFGSGLVSTPNDFGAQGAAPSHPELLDWLASELTRSGGSLKHLHRLIVLSATYRQSHQIRERAVQVDSDCRLLWRYPSRRAPAETIRDSMLAVSGRLRHEPGGPGFDFFESRGGLNGFPPIRSFSGPGLRRMIFAHKVRMERVPVFGAFDCPDAGQSAPARSRSTTPIQALNLFNSQFTLEESQAFAHRVTCDVGREPRAQIRRAWALALGREPTRQELEDALEFVASEGLPSLCRALYNTNEFLFIP